jgi:hypothetical protein
MSLWANFLSHRGKRSDKWTHYFPVYERHFARYVDRPILLLEIGTAAGGSLQLWRKYLGPYARIVGIDVNQASLSAVEDGIDVRIGDQSDTEFLAAVLAEFGTPDIVIDDGSHVASHMNATFDFLYPRVAEGGIYVAEDLHAGYWENYEGGLGREGTFIERVKGLIDELNAYWTRGALAPTAFTESTLSIHCYDSMVVFERGRLGRRKRFVVGGQEDAPPYEVHGL